MGRPAKFNDKEKWCPKCVSWVEIGNFGLHAGSASGRDDYCKPCKAKKNHKYAAAWKRQHLYGVSAEDVQALWDEQKGLCAVCFDPIVLNGFRQGHRKKACLDHDHVSGDARGLLCQKCNLGLGIFGDNLAVLAQAIAYLRKFS